MFFGLDENLVWTFLAGAFWGFVWCAVGLAAGWLMFRAPLGRRDFRSCVRIDAPAEKVWSSYLLEPSPPGGWGGALEISEQSFDGDPPSRHRAAIRHGGVGVFQESVWRVRKLEPYALFHVEQESLAGVAAPAHQATALRIRFIDEPGGATRVEHDLCRLVRGVFGFLYIPRANRRALDHLRRHCEGQGQGAAAPLLGRRTNIALAALAFAAMVALMSAGNSGVWEVAAFVAFFLQLALWTHEYGHLIAMRWFGHKDATLFFVPFMGGAAMGSTRARTAFEEAMVALMGPAFSGAIVLALTPLAPLGFSYFADPMQPIGWSTWLGLGVMAFLAMAIPINLYNLAPIRPLDGGRAIMVLARNRWTRAALSACVFAVIGYAIAGTGRANDLGAAVAFAAMAWASALLSTDQTHLDLGPMNRRERFVAGALLLVTLAIHVDASRSLLPTFLDSMRKGLASYDADA